ncbi:MAG: hypothetical protein ACRES3_06645 [Steroidobacteraceae bacterium]
MLATEHILLESEVRDVPELRTARKVHARLRIRSGLRRRMIELTLIDYFFLSVQISRSRLAQLQYVIDLRFVEPALRRSRHIAWRWMTVSAVLTALSVAVTWQISMSPTPWWQKNWLPVAGTLFGFAAGAVLVSIYRTTETLALYSANGCAKLFEITGGLGTIRAVRKFSLQLAAHLRIAIAARRPARAEHLRDEMREHHRLKCAGVLSEEEYEGSKRRILKGHGAPWNKVDSPPALSR